MSNPSASRRPPPPDPRRLALKTLLAVLEKGQPLDGALETVMTGSSLEPRDRAFVHLLTATTLRRLGQIDVCLDHCLDRPLPDRLAPVRMVLRLGAAQLLFLGTPPHAAVDRSVRLVAALGQPRLKGLVNAVLRRVTAEGPGWLATQDACRLATPSWLWDRWSDFYGEAVAREIAAATLEEPPLDLTVKVPGTEPAGVEKSLWAERLGFTVLPTGSLRGPVGGRLVDLPGYGDGAWWVQDAAAAIPVRLLGPVAGRPVLDLCAAPGGKTAQLAAAGADVTAVDRSAERMQRLAANLQRLKLAARQVVADVTTWEPAELFDAVLLDAPCSATGTLRRHPDIAHLKRPDAIERLSGRQAQLLTRAAAMLRPGGRLVYCTCSLEPEEGEARIAAFLETAGGGVLVVEPADPASVGLPASTVTPEGFIRTHPGLWKDLGRMDGFFMARLKKVG